MTEQPEPEDTCRPVDIDGETIRVRGSEDLTEEGQEALAALVRVAKAKFVADAPEKVGELQGKLRLAHKARRAKEHQLDDIRRALCDIGFMQDNDPYSHADLADVIRQNGPAATEATQAETTARVFAGLHHSAEQDVTRVINLYERWVKAGPPPLGVPLSRWWDQRLVELHNAILPPAEQPRTTANNPPTSGDAANNPLREQLAVALSGADEHSCQMQDGPDYQALADAALKVHYRDTAQLRRERDMALKAAREARGVVAHDAGPTVAEATAADRNWDVEQEAP